MKIKSLLTILLSVITISVFAQEKKYYEGGPLSHLNVALRTSLMGVGIEAATPLTSHLKLRAGINYMGYKSKSFDISLDDGNNGLEAALGYIPDYRMKGELDFTNGHLLVDYHPFKRGIFHLTGGFFIGKNQLKAKGMLVDDNGNPAKLKPGKEWPELEFDGKVLDINDGRLNANFQMGNIVKPYFGIGFGRVIPKRRVSFKFELGVIYQGDYTIKQNGRKVDVSNSFSENFADVDDYTKWLRWWPMINFQIGYRVF